MKVERNVGKLMGSLGGQTESNIRQALKINDAMAPAVCFIDECEKAFSALPPTVKPTVVFPRGCLAHSYRS